ncbi:hypothetical protein RHSIM_Rhsim05G0022900 [Rhododendron simsii]|uniref:Protein EFFECTOR OF TRANSCRIPTION 2-like n=1 Tax=Rhododendron simsii TaxID=118357 RepID=A0A834LPH7_RHOSS|nr:hypothetical protein RHSIM_Rhsim05G0022900 [Rhododendron simsii]
MGASKDYVVSSRLKREDCKRTKHDSVFSDWKILVGPSDWEDHYLGKEGAERYRVHNLPNCSSCSGLYELGIAVPHSSSSRETSKLDPDCIIPVYLGQAENVRTRLQRYGREGAHLENGKLTSELNSSTQQGLGLFSDIFARSYSVVYRWAPGDQIVGQSSEGGKGNKKLCVTTWAWNHANHESNKMKNKSNAEKIEAQLLDMFDYAWNKGSNGVRRPNDILQKLDRSTSPGTRFPAIVRKLLTFQEKKKGIKIEACKPLKLEKGSNTYAHEKNNDLLSQILKIGRSRLRFVSVKYAFDEDHATTCGVALGHGSVCRRIPVEGRKRCAEHKGMKVNALTSKLILDEKSPIDETTVDSGVDATSFCYDKVKPQLVTDSFPVGNNSVLICGITSDDGTLCKKQPVQGRKRCEEHKGRKITRSHIPHTTYSPVFSESAAMNETGNICGVDLKNGTVCGRQPVVGRKRCEEHKGMRVTGS